MDLRLFAPVALIACGRRVNYRPPNDAQQRRERASGAGEINECNLIT